MHLCGSLRMVSVGTPEDRESLLYLFLHCSPPLAM
nr:MAG TPA: hypothetical protein [Caudoviricetes sp.]